MRVWLFKSYVTDGNDILAKQVEGWAEERKVQVEFDWATFGDREQKFVAAIEAGNPPDIAEMNYQGPLRYRPALRDVTKLAKDLAAPRGGLLPFAERVAQLNGQYSGIPRLVFGGGLHIRKDILDGEGPQDAEGLRPRRPRHGQEVPGSVEGSVGLRPDAQPLRRRQRLHAEHPVGLRRWHLGQGRQARAGHHLSQGEHGGAPVRRRHDPEAQDPAARRDVVDRRSQQRGVHGRQAGVHQQRGQPLLRHGRQEAPAVREDPGAAHPGRAGRHLRRLQAATAGASSRPASTPSCARTWSAGSRTRSDSRST